MYKLQQRNATSEIRFAFTIDALQKPRGCTQICLHNYWTGIFRLTFRAISYPEPAIFRRRIESSGIIHNRKPEILAFLLDCYIPFCIKNQSDSPRFMDYPRALDSSPEDRGLGVRDCLPGNMTPNLVPRVFFSCSSMTPCFFLSTNQTFA